MLGLGTQVTREGPAAVRGGKGGGGARARSEHRMTSRGRRARARLGEELLLRVVVPLQVRRRRERVGVAS